VNPIEGFDVVWVRIVRQEGELFHQVRGRAFTYSIDGNVLRPSTTNRKLSKGQFEEAFRRMPVAGPGDFQDLQGPSYLYAVLTDPRITHGETK